MITISALVILCLILYTELDGVFLSAGSGINIKCQRTASRNTICEGVFPSVLPKEEQVRKEGHK